MHFGGRVLGMTQDAASAARCLFLVDGELWAARGRAARHPRWAVPLGGLELVGVRRLRGSGPEKRIPRTCLAVQCRDGDREVVIVCAPSCVGYVTHLLARPAVGRAIG
ncbi:hypothetical protein [Streptomyces avicenniae]|uniref:hypothetical protein n=1 Tax=Streptomyces avicenniae TaxID=500153 RepID=UPI000A8FE7C1|nr:hypothetical protein [Streptomyces avicenniae]